MIEFTQWCSMFCSGSPAGGDITISFKTGSLTLPVCDECAETLQNNPEKALALEPDVVLELGPDEEARGFIPTN